MRISDWSSDVCSSDLVGLQRVRGDAGIVAPDLAEQLLAADHGIAAAVEILEDRSLLLGQPHLLLRLAVGQQLCAGAEGVGSDGEDGILALLVLTKLGDRKSTRLNSSH